MGTILDTAVRITHIHTIVRLRRTGIVRPHTAGMVTTAGMADIMAAENLPCIRRICVLTRVETSEPLSTTVSRRRRSNRQNGVLLARAEPQEKAADARSSVQSGIGSGHLGIAGCSRLAARLRPRARMAFRRG